jgi:predicted dehydrogenase
MDTDQARLDAAVRRYPELGRVPQFRDHKKMIQQAQLEATLICSPHHAHYEQVVDSLRAGLHVLVEKPMVCTIEHAHAVMEEEKKAGKLVGIAYQRHCQGQFQFIRSAIHSGQAGEVRYVSAFQGQEWLQGTRGTWRQSKELSCGGQLNDSGSHLVDIILWVTGLAADEVSSAIDNCGTEVDINSSVSIRFKNGALGSLSIVGNCPTWWEDITIVCDRWAFFLRQGQLCYMSSVSGEMHHVDGFRYGSASPTHNFVAAVLGREQVLAPSVCGLRTIELTEAAWRSAETGKPVRL